MVHEENYILVFFGISILLCAGVSAGNGWKPIIPPADYYATMPTTCLTDCQDPKHVTRVADAVIRGDDESEIHRKPAWTAQPVVPPPNLRMSDSGNADLAHAGQHVNFLYKPVDVAYLPVSERKKPFGPPYLTYQDVYKKGSSHFYNVKAVIPKPAKTLYYGGPEIFNSKLVNDVKYFPVPFYPGKIGGGSDELKIVIQPADNTDLKTYKPLKEYHYDEYCTMFKVSFEQNLYYQYVQYKTRMPDLKEFTICLWFKLHNHSHEHSLLSYSAKPYNKDIYMWVSNLEDPGLFYMKVLGQTIFRLNYPFKVYKWYHTCQSWNGHTGEWQVWVNGNRIARGFHNLLVGHKIPGKGIVISGQEHRNIGKNFRGVSFYRFGGPGGLEGEITMLQMYKVALTAGKANNDHRHHHSHHTSTTPEPPEEPTEEMPTTTEHPLLENGQLKTHVNILELVETLKTKGHVEGLEHHDHNGHHDYLNNHATIEDHEALTHPLSLSYYNPIASLAYHGNNINHASTLDHSASLDHTIFKRNDGNNSQTELTKTKVKERKKDGSEESSITAAQDKSFGVRLERRARVKTLDNVSRPMQIERVKFPDESAENGTSSASSESEEKSIEVKSFEEFDKDLNPRNTRRERARRQFGHSTIVLTSRSRPRPLPDLKVVQTAMKKRRLEPKITSKNLVEEQKEPFRRFLVLADPYSSLGTIDVLGHSQYSSLPTYGQTYDLLPQVPQEHNEEEEEEEDDTSQSAEEENYGSPTKHELAENEVKKIMLMCSGCHVDPFRKVAVISWRTTPKKIYSGALLLKAKSECENF